MDRKDYKIIKDNVSLELDKLHIRYIPMAKLENWYVVMNGYNMMSLVNSPHVELMQIFKDHGLDWARIKKTRYWDERKFRKKLGMKEWAKKYLMSHIKKRYKIFDSISRRGFDCVYCWDHERQRDTSVLVHEKPFWCSRFGDIPGIEGWEIYNGAGRASAMYVLGYKTIPAKTILDTKPGSKKWENVEKRFK